MKLPDPSAARPQELTLVSHALCPYVQRAAIVLAEKEVPYTRRDVDLAAKPDWFLAISPLGKTPVLLADGQALFESAVICEYLDDTVAPRLHPGDALERARDRAWVEFGSSVLNTIAAYYNAPDAPALRARRAELEARFSQLEAALGDGPWFRARASGTWTRRSARCFATSTCSRLAAKQAGSTQRPGCAPGATRCTSARPCARRRARTTRSSCGNSCWAGPVNSRGASPHATLTPRSRPRA